MVCEWPRIVMTNVSLSAAPVLRKGIPSETETVP